MMASLHAAFLTQYFALFSLTGRNFAAGMSGGIAYVLDLAHDFGPKVNHEMVELGKVTDPKEIAQLRGLIEDHRHFTGSAVADRVLKNFNRMLSYFVRVIPLDYKRVLEENAAREIEEKARQSMLDLIPSQAQLDAEAASGASTPKHPEPSVGDVEDAMLDTETAVARGAKLDKVRGFMKYKRMGESYRPARKRTKDWSEVSSRLKPAELQVQVSLAQMKQATSDRLIMLAPLLMLHFKRLRGAQVRLYSGDYRSPRSS